MIPAGTKVPYTITFLEMTEAPEFRAPDLPDGFDLIHAEDAPVWYFLALYRAVGRDWEWQDRLIEPEVDVAKFAEHPKVEIWTLLSKGWPRGFFVLDFRQANVCDLAYFGLVPEAVGRGVGKTLLQRAVTQAWRTGINRLTVNTCTLDHPRALGLYQTMGFRPVRTEEHYRVLSRARLG
ncbi:MAG: GNAT family N-acetyltransferase [Pseudomonadota bacterium]